MTALINVPGKEPGLTLEGGPLGGQYIDLEIKGIGDLEFPVMVAGAQRVARYSCKGRYEGMR